MCCRQALPLVAKYFPYLVLIHPGLHALQQLLVQSSWLPSSKIEHFISILGKCLTLPGPLGSLIWSFWGGLRREGQQEEQHEQVQHHPVWSRRQSGQLSVFKVNSWSLWLTNPLQGALDKRKGIREQGKALFEKVKKFRLHVERRWYTLCHVRSSDCA